MSGKGKCIFNSKWLKNDSYKGWLKCTEDKHKALCTVCNRSIDVSAMGESALKSHMKGSKHIEKNKAVSSSGTNCDYNIKSFFSPDCTKTCDRDQMFSETCVRPSDLHDLNNNSTASPTISTYAFKLDDVLKAEIMWTLNLITTHQSYKSAETSSKLFQAMFCDSEIARNFACGERKTAYISVFGIAEHFQSLLMKDITGPFVVLFDESLNKKMQQKQMDVHVRFWNENKVETRYFTSVFIGKCCISFHLCIQY